MKTLEEINLELKALGYNSEIVDNKINLSEPCKYPFNDNSYTLTVQVKPDKDELKVMAKGRNSFWMSNKDNSAEYLDDLIKNHWT